VRTQVSTERETSAPTEAEKTEGDPVWLKRLRARRSQDELAPSAPQPPAEPEAAAPGELPEWLSKIRDKSSPESGPLDAAGQPYPPIPFDGADSGSAPTTPWGEAAPTQQPRATGPVGGEEPDWLKYPADTGGPPGAGAPAPSPDWMGEISSALEQTPPNPPTGGLPAMGEGAETGGIFPKPTSPFTEPPGTPSDFGPGWEFPSETPAEFPFPPPVDDSSQMAPTAPFHDVPPPAAAGRGEGVPDWLADAQSQPAVPAPEPEVEEPAPLPTPDLSELLRPDAIPDWLSKPAEAEAPGPEGGPARPPAALPENLEQAELPRWLEAMRPIQSVAVPTEDEERVESVGPLAGLRGVLSAEPVVAMPRRPGIMAGNIDALPAQTALTDILRRMLVEPEVRAARRPMRAMLLTPVIRKVMSGVLLLAILLPMSTGKIFSEAVYQPQANIQAGELVDALPADRPVLVAFEYDASSAPEIESGATVLLEHLARRSIATVFISSQPNGTMLADGLRKLNEEMGVPMPPLAADFGYIPGGAGGLRRLNGELRDVIHNPSLDWSSEELAAVHTVSDFSMILLFAARPQSVRDWVEQVHTAAPNTPIVAMVSAASDALVFPYTQGSDRAIHGLVTGYSGAQAYRTRFLPDTLEGGWLRAVRWQAFGSGTLALLFTLSAGIIGSLALRYLHRDRKGAG
jgi:hypothetical protein